MELNLCNSNGLINALHERNKYINNNIAKHKHLEILISLLIAIDRYQTKLNNLVQ